MSSNTIQNKEVSLRSLASKLYFEVDDSLLHRIESYLETLQFDLNLLLKIDTSSSPIYYGKDALRLSSGEFKELNPDEIENQRLLEVFLSSYEFTNIKSKE